MVVFTNTYDYVIQTQKQLWIVNRFDVNKRTSPEQARKNISVNRPTELSINLLTNQLEEEKRAVIFHCKTEILKLLNLGSAVCKMTYCSKFTGIRLVCSEPRHMWASWLGDCGDVNIKRIIWIFHQLPWFCYPAATLGHKIHQDIVVRMIKDKMNIEFIGKEDMLPKQQTCIQQMYCRVLNQMKQNLLKKDEIIGVDVQVGLKRSKEYRRNNERKNYQREKTEFYVSRRTRVGGLEEFQVSKRNSTWVLQHDT